jgi:UDP-glucose 4-epimerase
VRALVTGGAGFIGSCLVDRLIAEGYAVDAVDDLSSGRLANLADARATAGHPLAFHQLDIRSPDLFALAERRRPEVVFHLAARPGLAATDPVAEAEIDVIGSLRVLEAARRCGAAKVVYASSAAAIYGTVAARNLPVKESHPQRPQSAAGVGKKAVADYLALYRDRYDLEYTVLALASVYGPRQAAPAPVAAFAARLAAGDAPVVEGDGRQTRDFVYIDDVVDALARAATRGGGLLINVGTGVETSLNELAGLLASLAGAPAAARRGPARSPGVRRLALDARRAGLHLGWEAWTPLAEGLAATWAWWRDRPR